MARNALLSLHEVFASAHEIRDLAAKPHEKIALLRLLICITQAALDGPEDQMRGKTAATPFRPKAKAYLEKWQAAFELFGDGPRFLQVPGLKPGKEDGEGNPATKLDLALASGNNASIFDNAAGTCGAVQAGAARADAAHVSMLRAGRTHRRRQVERRGHRGQRLVNHAPCIPVGHASHLPAGEIVCWRRST